jgi:hypothetical protein
VPRDNPSIPPHDRRPPSAPAPVLHRRLKPRVSAQRGPRLSLRVTHGRLQAFTGRLLDARLSG